MSTLLPPPAGDPVAPRPGGPRALPAGPADRLARLAAEVLDAPTGLLTLVQGERVILSGAFGLTESLARSWAAGDTACARVVGTGSPLVVEDAGGERNLPLLLGELRAGAYAAVPLLADGRVVGTLAVLDRRPRAWSWKQISMLTDLSSLAPLPLQRGASRRAVRPFAWALKRGRTRRRTRPVDPSDGVFVLDLEGRFVSVNRVAEQLWGRTRDELLGRFPREFPEVVDSGVYRVCGAAFHHREAMRTEVFCPALLEWYEVRCTPRDGAFVVRFREVTGSRERESALRETNRELDAVLAALPAAVVATDPAGRVIVWNPAAERMLGWTAAEVLGGADPSLAGWVAPSGHPEERARGDRVQVRRTSGGSELRLRAWTAPLADDSGAVRGTVAFLTAAPSPSPPQAAPPPPEPEAAPPAPRPNPAALARRILRSTLDPEAMLPILLRTAIPELADSCILYVDPADGAAGRVVVVDRVARREEAFRALLRETAIGGGPSAPLAAQVLASGEPLFLPELAGHSVEGFEPGSADARLLQLLAPRSLIVVPIPGRAGIVGALTLSIAEEGRAHGPAQLAEAGALADVLAEALAGG